MFCLPSVSGGHEIALLTRVAGVRASTHPTMLLPGEQAVGDLETLLWCDVHDRGIGQGL